MARDKDGRAGKRLRRFGIITIVAVYILILIGGIVRSTGSGMGCPDWPKCFGKFIPPASVGELPDNYREIYAEKRFEKNQRLASVLKMLNYNTLANKLLSDESIYQEAEFNPLTTWIEYINRLVGVCIGLLIIGVVIFSFPFLSLDKPVFFLSMISLGLVIFEGWLGAIVVSTNLLPFMVTVHMVGALILVTLLIYIISRSQKNILREQAVKYKNLFILVLWIISGATLLQIILGTQVRQNVDVLLASGLLKDQVIANMDALFYIHRSFSIVLLLLHAVLLYMGWVYLTENRLLYTSIIALAAILFVVTLSGIGMSWYAVPAWLQPVHLTLASLTFGLQCFILINLYYAKTIKPALT